MKGVGKRARKVGPGARYAVLPGARYAMGPGARYAVGPRPQVRGGATFSQKCQNVAKVTKYTKQNCVLKRIAARNPTQYTKSAPKCVNK